MHIMPAPYPKGETLDVFWILFGAERYSTGTFSYAPDNNAQLNIYVDWLTLFQGWDPNAGQQWPCLSHVCLKKLYVI